MDQWTIHNSEIFGRWEVEYSSSGMVSGNLTSPHCSLENKEEVGNSLAGVRDSSGEISCPKEDVDVQQTVFRAWEIPDIQETVDNQERPQLPPAVQVYQNFNVSEDEADSSPGIFSELDRGEINYLLLLKLLDFCIDFKYI